MTDTPPEVPERGGEARRRLNDCRFLTLEWHDRTKTTTATCSCGWTAATEEADPYRASLFRIDALTHEWWALRHRPGKS